MAYTSVDQLRGHLVSNYPVQEKVTDQQMTLSDDSVRIFPGPITESSVVVKARRISGHARLTMTIVESGNQISGASLVPGSVVVASDSSLGLVYDENSDYVIDYPSGRLLAKSGGRITIGHAVVVWFVPYTILVRDEDYTLDAEAGRIRRLAGGSIASGETVYLDFIPRSSDLSESLLEAAVAEANGLVEREVDPQGEYGADPALSLAATYCALEIICRTSAARELSSLRSEDRVALAWMKLADSYRERSDNFLSKFRPKLTGPARPSRT
jgi:hypothetical protein